MGGIEFVGWWRAQRISPIGHRAGNADPFRGVVRAMFMQTAPLVDMDIPADPVGMGGRVAKVVTIKPQAATSVAQQS